ncbi:uncharacterized protein LOC128265625 [Drosophila gunungcola]|uniref:uncharacterized protein LOC128265625 n=1 Tax=Drosophila gunungcola TaxID=103775 RepID=UPI0022E350C1|nr:uncharacterized protein LOC128265625 [Drosophila gunungcola]
MLTHQPTEPFAFVGADFVGPLPRTRRGNTMLLVFIDVFSKWVEFIPLKKAAQLEFGSRERILSRVGAPRRLICDNGTQFTSRSFRAYCRNNGIQLEYTAPVSPSKIRRSAQPYTQDNDSTIYSTGCSPAYLVQGREPRLPGGLFDAVASDLHVLPWDPRERAKRLQEAFRTAMETNQKASQQQNRHYNLRRHEWRPQIGSQVLVRLHDLSRASEGFNAKLAPKCAGPFQVVEFLSSDVVRKQQERFSTHT